MDGAVARRRLQVAICIASLLVIARECHFDGDDMSEAGRDLGGGLAMLSDGHVVDAAALAAPARQQQMADASQRRGR